MASVMSTPRTRPQVPAYVRDMVARLGDRMNLEHENPEMGSRVKSNNGERLFLFTSIPYCEARQV